MNEPPARSFEVPFVEQQARMAFALVPSSSWIPTAIEWSYREVGDSSLAYLVVALRA